MLWRQTLLTFVSRLLQRHSLGDTQNRQHTSFSFAPLHLLLLSMLALETMLFANPIDVLREHATGQRLCFPDGIENVATVAEDLIDFFEMAAVCFREEQVHAWSHVSRVTVRLGGMDLQGRMRNKLMQA